MKFDPFIWQEFEPNAENECDQGLLQVLCSSPSPLYITTEGLEVLAGYGTSFRLHLSQEATWRVDAPDTVRVFAEQRVRETFVPIGEVFTNIDRKPNESGMALEVTKALRLMKLEQRALLDEIRQAKAEKRDPVDPAVEAQKAVDNLMDVDPSLRFDPEPEKPDDTKA